MLLRSFVSKSFKNIYNFKQITKLKPKNLQKKVALPVSLNAAAFTINELKNTSIEDLFKTVICYVLNVRI